MMIRGKVKAVSHEYPYRVEMVSGKVFTSHWKFEPGMIIRLHLSGDLFTNPWPSGFVYCRPNGMSTYGPISEERIKAAKDPKAEHWTHALPYYVRLAIAEGPQKWSSVESFYKYFYTCTFDPKTRTITTNYSFRFI